MSTLLWKTTSNIMFLMKSLALLNGVFHFKKIKFELGIICILLNYYINILTHVYIDKL